MTPPSLSLASRRAAHLWPSMLWYTLPPFFCLWLLGGFTLRMPQSVLLPLSSVLAVLMMAGVLILAHLMDYRQAGDTLFPRLWGFLCALPPFTWGLVLGMTIFSMLYGYLVLPHTVNLPLLDNQILPNALGTAALLMTPPLLGVSLWGLLFLEGTRQNPDILKHPFSSMLHPGFFPVMGRFALYPLVLAILNGIAMTLQLGLIPQFLLWGGFLFAVSTQYFLLKSLFFGEPEGIL